MSRSHWLPVIAVVGLALASPAGHCGDSKQAATTQQQRNASQSEPIQKAYKPNRSTPNCGPGSYDRNSALCAEWKSADAAQQAANAADRTITIGWIGVALTGLIMAAAVAAAIYAKHAADAAKRTITVMRRMTYAQTRAYLSADYSRMFMEFGGGIILHITNIGETPSRWIEIESNASLIEPGITAFEVAINPHGSVQRWPIDATGGRDIECSPDCGDTEFEGLLEKGSKERKYLVFQGMVRWETVFGEIFESAFFFWGLVEFRGMKKDADDTYKEIPIHLSRPCLPIPTYRQLKGADEGGESDKHYANQ